MRIVFTVLPSTKKATVFWGKKRLGVIAPHAPLIVQRPRDSGPLDVVVRAEGCVPVQTRAYTFEDSKVAVKLTPIDQKNTLLGYREELPAADGGVARRAESRRRRALATAARGARRLQRAAPTGCAWRALALPSRIEYQSRRAMKKTRVLVLFDTDGEPPASQDWKKQIESGDEAEFDVARALIAKGHEVRLFGFRDNLDHLTAGLRAEPADVVFNLSERFPGKSGARLHGGRRARDARPAVHGRVVRGADARARQGADQEGVRLPGHPDPALHGLPARRRRRSVPATCASR